MFILKQPEKFSGLVTKGVKAKDFHSAVYSFRGSCLQAVLFYPQLFFDLYDILDGGPSLSSFGIGGVRTLFLDRDFTTQPECYITYLTFLEQFTVF